MPICWNLQNQTIKAYAVVVSYRAFVLLTQDVIQATAYPWNEGAAFFHRRLCKFGVECGQVDLFKIAIGRLHVANLRQGAPCEASGCCMKHQARKRFGQNFLVDRHVIDAIVRAIAPQPGEVIVEIGPGLGA